MEGQLSDKGPLIGPYTTVREAVKRYPGIEAVFERHGLGNCGGPDGPIEPVAFFARVHQVDPASLLRELNAYASRRSPPVIVPVTDQRAKQPVEPWRIAVVLSLAIALLGGFPLGILAALGGAHDVGLGTRWAALVQAHGHLQIVGFAGVFIAGVAYHVLPRFKNTELAYRSLAVPSIALLASGSVLRVVTQPWADNNAVAVLMVASAYLELAGVIAFAVVVLATLRSASRKNYDRYLAAAVLWFVAASVANVILVGWAAADGSPVIASAKDGPLLEMYLLGFITLFILGVSIRVLPHFLGLRPPGIRLFAPGLVLLIAGLLVEVVSGWIAAYSGWSRPDWLHAISVYSMAAGFITFAAGLNIHRPSVRDETANAAGPHEKLIRTAYAWLAVAVAIEVWYASRAFIGDFQPDFLQNGAARHALALGFITQMIFGVGTRALPSFAGKRLYSTRIVTAAWLLLNVAAVTRVAPALLPTGGAASRFDHIALSGAIALAAVALFAFNIYRTLRPARYRSAREPRAGIQVPVVSNGSFRPTPDTIVADILANVPGSLEMLISYGFKPLADPEMRARLTPHVTLGTACAMHGIDTAAVIGDLDRLQGQGHARA